MQLMPATARMEGFRGDNSALYDPKVNVPLGAKHLRRLLDQQQNIPARAIAAYNAGSAAVARWRDLYGDELDPRIWVELIPYKETREYAKRVLAAYWTYDGMLR